MKVSCFGSNRDEPASAYSEMKRAGALLAGRGVEIATGAFGGIGMRAPAEGATETGSGVSVFGFTYGSDPPNEYITEVVDCHRLAQHIPFEADYCLRLAGLLSSDAFIVAAGGGPGTFLELVATINFNQKFWKPMKRTAILQVGPTGGDGAKGGAVLDSLKAWGVLSEDVAGSIRVVNSAEQAVRWVCDGVR